MNPHIFSPACILFLVSLPLAPAPAVAEDPIDAVVMEAYPDEIQARLETRDRHLRQARESRIGEFSLEFVIDSVNKWTPGQTLRVAFNGGGQTLHEAIASVASEWTKYGNVKLDFGRNEETGAYRTWSTTDDTYKADIRISFHHGGYWSLVGNDSIDPAILAPGQASMNFSGFDVQRPSDWAATVLHEFGHTLSFHHEHQHPIAGCDSEFRWQDDPGYTPTTDQFGQYIEDDHGKRPGIYTVLGGPPNNWPKWKVDHNLRQLDSSSHAYEVGPFDGASIMKYFFPAWMFREGEGSHCFTSRNSDLSSGDRIGIRTAYPSDEPGIERLAAQCLSMLETLTNTRALKPEAKRHYADQLERLREP